MVKKRLSKALSHVGVASRRHAEELIFDGRVAVNGKITLVPQTLVDPDEDAITVDGNPISVEKEKVYFVLNKPKGYLCSHTASSKAPLIYELFDPKIGPLISAGRLDKDTTGLLLVTNDGTFANRVIHPSSCVEKEYYVETREELTDKHLLALSKGTRVEGIFVVPKQVERAGKRAAKITVMEGKKREIRQMIEAISLTVRKLTRIRIGGLELGKLPGGTYRHLTKKEKEAIFS